jgi:hypothetical protein
MNRTVRVILVALTVTMFGAAAYLHWRPEPYPTVEIKLRLNTPLPEKPAAHDHAGHDHAGHRH